MLDRSLFRYLGHVLCIAAVLACALPVAAVQQKQPTDNLDMIVYVSPELRVVETPVDLTQVREELPNGPDLEAMLAEIGEPWHIVLDRRRAVPTLIDGGAIPFHPGPANRLRWRDSSCRQASCIPIEKVEAAARDLLERHSRVFQVDPKDLVLDPDGSLAIGRSIYLLRFQWLHQGIPVERGSVYFRINNGNLIQMASERIGPIALDARPQIESKTAMELVADYLGPYASRSDEYLDKGSLRIIPVTPAGQTAESFDGLAGTGISYRLAYRFAFVRPGVRGTWEALVDAHSGELLRFVDANRYGRVHGGAYPGDNHVGEADRPFPFADTGLPAPDEYADAGGFFPGDNATTTLQGKYTWITDHCGTGISNTTTTGDVDFGVGPGTDCDVPSPNYGGDGNTHAARTQYWHLTNVNMKARTYMPTNTWLNTSHMNVNVNQSAYCNASSGGGTLQFYQGVPGDCWNLGEIPGVALHEWGHSMDDYDGSGGDSPPVETRADWTATLQTHDSCVGRGFDLTGDCGGYGDPCLDCTGIRDLDYTMHEEGTPWTAVNYGTVWSGCSGGFYFGPCGLEDHCESGISSQALWELVNTDLLGAAGGYLDLPTAWMLSDRLFYAGMPTIGDMYSCTVPSSDGCTGSTLYNVMRAIDDDGDGTANGTPHAAAIFAALNRHNIACGAVDDQANQNQSSCPSLVITTLSGEIGSNSATLSWPAVSNATRYLIYRNEVGCDAGFTKVGEVAAPATEFTDTTLVNGIEYYFRIVAATASDSCTSLMSNCVTLTPQPCAGTATFDQATYSCDDLITIAVLDGDLAGTTTLNVEVWSDSEPTPETVTLSEAPAGSGNFTGTIDTAGTTGTGDGAIGVVHGDTITVRYVDQDYCGAGPQNVDNSAMADCLAPLISDVQISDVTGMSAACSWLTDEAADSLVVYEDYVGAVPGTPPTAFSAFDGGLVSSHAVALQPLNECTDYYLFVASTDAAGNTVEDDASGSYYAFTTGVNVQPSYASADTPVPITDYNTVTSTITVVEDKEVLEVEVLVNISHTYDGDLSFSLIGPDSTTVLLCNRRGSSSNDFVDTLFDDDATSPISSGTAPFTGSFQPEEPLSAFDGISSTGAWTLSVTDNAGNDVGSIDSWTLNLTYPATACGPHCAVNSHDSPRDLCRAGGAGNGDGIWDPGERVWFSVTLKNDGTDPITGVKATVSPLTAGVVMDNETFTFADMAAGETAVSPAPHFSALLPTSLSCGDTVSFQIAITTVQGSWTDTFSRVIGLSLPGNGTALDEDFDAAGIPATWTIIDGSGDGNTWFTDNAGDPQGCNNTNPASPIAGNWAAVDSDCALYVDMDEQLITPVLDLSAATTVSLAFDHYYNDNGSEVADVDVSSSLTGGAWVNVGQWTSDTSNPQHEEIDITAQAAGASDVRVRWHYYNANYEWYWYIDNVEVSFTAPGGCLVNDCPASVRRPRRTDVSSH